MARTFLVLSLFLSPSLVFSQLDYPRAHRQNQVDTIFGVRVEDPYRNLEIQDAQTLDWRARELELTERYRKKELKDYMTIGAKLRKYSYVDHRPLTKRGDYYYFMRYDYLDKSPSLYRQKYIKDTPKKIVDAFVLGRKHENVEISGFEVSSDEKYLAFTLSLSGSDWSEIRIVNTHNHKYLDDVIQWVKFSNIAWKGEGFFYWRYDPPFPENRLLERVKNKKLYYHKLNTSQNNDDLIYESADGDIIGSSFKVTTDQRYLIVDTNQQINGIWQNVILYKDLDGDNKFKVLLAYTGDDIYYSVIDHVNGRFFMTTNDKANNGKIISVDLNDHTVCEIVKEYSNVISQVSMISNKLVTLYYQDGKYALLIFDLSGKVLGTQLFEEGQNVSGLNGDNNDTETTYFVNTFYHPEIVYKLDLTTNIVSLISTTGILFDYTQFESKYFSYPSRDGTFIPMFLTYKKGTNLKSGTSPVLLYGYGGFGIPLVPGYSAGYAMFMEAGGILATPQIRGGGEFGEKWHNEATKLKKQNSFDDFISAAEFLIKINVTKPERIAIHGGSNGGLLVGAVMTQRPDLFKVAVAEVGVFDMVRYDRFGLNHIYHSEFGDPADSVEFRNLLKYSPLHNIKNNTQYPATLLITADKDDRVPPLHSYKFIATLQEKSSNSIPFLLYVDLNAGHNGPSNINDGIKSPTLKYSFIFKHLGMQP